MAALKKEAEYFFCILFFHFFSYSTLLGLYQYVCSRFEKRKVLQEIQQNKAKQLVSTQAGEKMTVPWIFETFLWGRALSLHF